MPGWLGGWVGGWLGWLLLLLLEAQAMKNYNFSTIRTFL